jgi:hypothetical protein
MTDKKDNDPARMLDQDREAARKGVNDVTKAAGKIAESTDEPVYKARLKSHNAGKKKKKPYAGAKVSVA